MRARPFGLLVVPLLGYPLMAACLLLADAWRGEHLLSFYLGYEQRLLWDTFWSDYLAALPAMYVVVAVAAGGILLLRRFRPSVSTAGIVPLLSAFGWAAATHLTGAWVGTTHVAMLIAGALLGGLAAISMRPRPRPQPGGMPT